MIMYVMISLIITIIILLIGLNIKISDIKKLKKISKENDLNKITNKLSGNTDVCNDILKILKNKDVKVEENKDTKTSLYMVISNKIIIANIDKTFTRIQTIAHECIHSVQNKNMLKFNFIFSNIYLIYFLIASIFTIFKLVDCFNLLLAGLIVLGFIYVSIRSFLEVDAMTRARFVAEKYIENKNILSEKEKTILFDKYDEINRIGIKLYYFTLISKYLLHIAILCFLNLIFH